MGGVRRANVEILKKTLGFVSVYLRFDSVAAAVGHLL
jgi:hypothetical protein